MFIFLVDIYYKFSSIQFCVPTYSYIKLPTCLFFYLMFIISFYPFIFVL